MSAKPRRFPDQDAWSGRARPRPRKHRELRRYLGRRSMPLFTAAVAVSALLIASLVTLTSCGGPPSQWRVVSSSNLGTSSNILYGVAAVSGSDVWAVGGCLATSSGPCQTLVMHYS